MARCEWDFSFFFCFTTIVTFLPSASADWMSISTLHRLPFSTPTLFVSIKTSRLSGTVFIYAMIFWTFPVGSVLLLYAVNAAGQTRFRYRSFTLHTFRDSEALWLIRWKFLCIYYSLSSSTNTNTRGRDKENAWIFCREVKRTFKLVGWSEWKKSRRTLRKTLFALQSFIDKWTENFCIWSSVY